MFIVAVVAATLLAVACFNDLFPSWLAVTILTALSIGAFLYS